MPSNGLSAAPAGALARHARSGLDAPICLTWELTYACNLSCIHCLSASGRRDPNELTTAECKRVLDELAEMQVFYINVGGGEPTVRSDFWELLDYAIEHRVGVKFSTNGVRIDGAAATRLAATDYVDVQISIDGADAQVNDVVRGTGSFAVAISAMENLATAGFAGFKISVVVTRQNAEQLTPSPASPIGTAHSCGSPGCARPGGARTCGMSCTRRPRSSVSSTTGWSPAARTC